MPRPALERRLDDALRRRLTLVLAGAGFGKSTLLSSWAARVRSCWYTASPEDTTLTTVASGIVDALRLRVPGLPPEVDAAIRGWRGPDGGGDEATRAQAFAAALCDALEPRVRRDLVLVIDDVDEIAAGSPSARLIDALCRHAPRSFHLVLASRSDAPFAIERLRGAGEVMELGGRDLALSVEETRELVTSILGDDSTDIATRLRGATGGWPVATRLAVEALRNVPPGDRADTLARAGRPGGVVYSYLAAEVFRREPPSTTALVRVAALLESFTAELCERLGVADAAAAISSLARRGLFLEPQGQADGRYSLSALVREFALARLPIPDEEQRRIHALAAQWYAAHGQPEAALRSCVAARDHPGITAVLREHGPRLLGSGAADAVIGAVDLLPPAERDRDVWQLLGEAQQVRGEWDEALASFERARAGLAGTPASAAWRIGLIHHLRGRLDEALAAYASGRRDGSEPADEALLLSWSASAHWLRGDAEACRSEANDALERATASGDHRALAAAHTALALLAALDGDRAANDAHYLRALEHASVSGDILQTIRIRANRGSHHAEEGHYEEAVAELDLAIGLADLGGFASLRALALTNRGEVKLRTGGLDEAIVDLEAAKALYQRAGSRMVAYPLAKLGEVYRVRGDLALARAACEEAIATSEAEHDLQGLVPALATLAQVVAGDDPEAAAAHAQRAVAAGPGMGYVQALLASARVALGRGEQGEAARAAEAAAAAARARRDTPGLAAALELGGAAADRRTRSVALIEESLAIWRGIGDPIGIASAELALARVSDPRTGRAFAERALRAFRELGSRAGAAEAARFLAELERTTRAPLEVRTLGAFAVLRDGTPVPPAEWQSKKARDLLKILVTHRGRPASRDALMETLWPDEDVGPLAGRLSVALATVRSVLGGKRPERERAIVADKDAVRLDLTQVEVDVERFLHDADGALAVRRKGASPDAIERLEAAEAAYTGDFLEDDAYAEWATALREEARVAYANVARALAKDAAAARDEAAASRFWLRILARDAYDEQAHLGLVTALAAASRHGEARRFYRTYAARMEEIGVEAAPFPSALSRP